MIRLLDASATVLVLLALALPGCGGGGGQGETPTTPTTTAPAPAQPGGTSTTLQQQGSQEDEGSPLLAWADVDNDEGKAPLTVQFKADIEGGKPPIKVTWKFGDGTPDSNETNPKHTYEKPGKYRADLEVSDASGDSDSDYVEVEVQ
jgi:PKD repeat protein